MGINTNTDSIHGIGLWQSQIQAEIKGDGNGTCHIIRIEHYIYIEAYPEYKAHLGQLSWAWNRGRRVPEIYQHRRRPHQQTGLSSCYLCIQIFIIIYIYR